MRLKSHVDRELIRQAVAYDSTVIDEPLRSSEITDTHVVGLSEQVIPDTKLDFLSLPILFHTLTKLRQHYLAYMKIPDGSHDVQEALLGLTHQDIALCKKFDTLHSIGTNSHIKDIIAPMVAVRMIQRGISDIAGTRRTTIVGFEHEQMCCSHPHYIDSEMRFLGDQVDAAILDINLNHTHQTRDLAQSLASTRFCTAEQVDMYTEKELLALILASETQRIIAYIHPWFERVGRTSEEVMALICLECNVRPVFLSTPNNRSTIEGYERGIILAMTAIPIIREIARINRFEEDDITKIYSVRDLYQLMSNKLDLSFSKRIMYASLLKHWHGHTVFPDDQLMQIYFETLHIIVNSLISSLNLDSLIKDPLSLYLTGHLIGRGKR